MAHASGVGSSNSNTYMWLNGGEPRKYYKCSLCNLSFKSMNALGGHQNAHRRQRNQMQKLMNINLRTKKKLYYEFMPLKEGNVGIYGYGCGFQNPYYRLMMVPTSFAVNWVPSYAALPNINELDLSLKL